jgi:hypothetical protein
VIVLVAGLLVSSPFAARAAETVDSKLGRATFACEPKLLTPVIAGAIEKPGEQTTPVKVKVGGRVFVLEKENGERAESLSIYPADATSVLVAIIYRDNAEQPCGSETLWRVPCDSAKALEKFADVEGADFGHSALARSGRTLFFTGADGVLALDLVTGKSRRVTHPTFPYCTETVLRAIDVVLEVDTDGTLFVDRGCSYEWHWHSQGMKVRNPESAKPVTVRITQLALTTVAVDAGGGIWLSDGDCHDSRTDNLLRYSPDRGQHWRKVLVKGAPGIPWVDQPVWTILTDNKNPKALLVFQMSCISNGQHTEAAWSYVTEDGGATFRPIGLPPGITPDDEGKGPEAETDPLFGIAALRGSLSDLILFSSGSLTGPWKSRDLGRTWKQVPLRAIPFKDPPDPQRSATFANWKVTIERESLFLSVEGEPGRTRIYPRH